jgi:hypothetical protein
MTDKNLSDRIAAESDRILGVIEKKLLEHRMANPQVREKIRLETIEKEMRRLPEDLRDPVKAKILDRRPKPKMSDTIHRQSEERRLNTRIKMLEKKVAELEGLLAQSDREQMLRQLLEPLHRELGQEADAGQVKNMSAEPIGRLAAELYKFASNFEDFVLGVIAGCEKSRARRRVLPGQDLCFPDLIKRFATGDESSGPDKIAAHIKVLYTWLVQIITGYKTGSTNLYGDLWNSGLKEIHDALREGNFTALKDKKIEKILDSLPPMRVEAQLQESMSNIILKRKE